MYEEFQKVVDEYIQETEESGVEGFRRGITLKDIKAILDDLMIYAQVAEQTATEG